MSGIGVDSWVAEADERLRRSRAERLAAAVAARVPLPARIAVLALPAALLPFLTSSDYVIRVGVNTLLFVLLALGLNVVVGWAGLLDLGYVAVYGFGGYLYAWLASEKFGLHLSSLLVLPLVLLASALLGLLLGLPSRRLLGDYLAIVTLFFAQIFVVLTTNANRITLPWNDEPTDFTGGPNGISGVDPLAIGSWAIDSIKGYYWLCLAAAALVALLLGYVDVSRIGRAWRSLREDSLAAELMGMPTVRLKLLAFAVGASVAGFSGAVFAAVQQGVFPQNFGIPLLITLYAMVILGGAGSLGGVALGAVVVNVVLEVLRTPDQATWLFVVAVVAGLLAFGGPRRGAILLGVTVALGLVATTVAAALEPAATAGRIEGGTLARVLEHWVVHPADGTRLGQLAIAGVLALVVAAVYLPKRLAVLLVPPLLYLAAVGWVNVLVENPSVTRLILLGALLIVLMRQRPQGLLGRPRVEIV